MRHHLDVSRATDRKRFAARGSHHPRANQTEGNIIKRFGKFSVIYLDDYFAVIDTKFVSRVEQFTWCKHKKGRNGNTLWYATTNRNSQKQQGLHAVILGDRDGFVIDHIDGNGLNNTLQNLRHVTHSQNRLNVNYDKPVFSFENGIPEWVKNG